MSHSMAVNFPPFFRYFSTTLSANTYRTSEIDQPLHMRPRRCFVAVPPVNRERSSKAPTFGESRFLFAIFDFAIVLLDSRKFLGSWFGSVSKFGWGIRSRFGRVCGFRCEFVVSMKIHRFVCCESGS